MKLIKYHPYWTAIIATIFVLGVVVPVIDYYNVGIGRLGWFQRNDSQSLVTWLVGIASGTVGFLALIVSLSVYREAQRQNEIRLRPYLRLAWVTEQVGDNRRAQGITDSCLAVVNEGQGLMRNVKYNVAVDDAEVRVRSHTLINSKGNPTIVVYADDNEAREALGSRNDNDWVERNNQIIRESTIKVWGTYEDIESTEYQFSFKSDTKSQSWFMETAPQDRL